ncbi:MAG TPA: hypothetical protein VHG27_02550 [Xanthobacteraceae bacterium]|nr:hypothetical protein [Xanthobacteraceae bacterium]
MSEEPRTTSDPKTDTPFPRHRIYYLALKVAVIVVAIFAALFYFGAL